MIQSLVFTLLVLASTAFGQYGHRNYRGTNHIYFNQIECRYYNYGLMGNINATSFAWPRETGDEYIQDFSPLLGAEFVHPSSDTLHSVITSDGPRGSSDGPPGGGGFWGFEPLGGFVAVPPPDADHSAAMSNQTFTWPDSWPDHTAEWNGHWIGPEAPGMTWASQESYFQMDDNSDREWRVRNGQTLYPFPGDTSRGGIGLRVEVRGMEYIQTEYEDAIVLMYILHNDGQVNILRTRFGFMVDPCAGGRADLLDDVCTINADTTIAYTWDSNDQGGPGWVPLSPEHNVGVSGVTFLKTPGQRKITAFETFSPPAAIRMNDDARLWTTMQPGRFVTSATPRQGNYVVSTGDFAMMPGSADTIIAAVVFGEDLADLEGKVVHLRDLVANGMHVPASEHPVSLIPDEFRLTSIYPNPFNPQTTITFSLPRAAEVDISFYDILGRKVGDHMRAQRLYTAGEHSITFDGSALSTGIYFVRLETESSHLTGKMILMK